MGDCPCMYVGVYAFSSYFTIMCVFRFYLENHVIECVRFCMLTCVCVGVCVCVCVCVIVCVHTCICAYMCNDSNISSASKTSTMSSETSRRPLTGFGMQFCGQP